LGVSSHTIEHLESTIVFVYSLYNFDGATMNIKDRLLMSISIVKRFWWENLAGSRDLWTGACQRPHIWDPWPQFGCALYNFHGDCNEGSG